MTAHGAPAASAEVSINASAETVYRLLTDLSTFAELAEETTAMSWSTGDSARPGAVFTGKNRNGKRTWTTKCTITDAAPGRVFGFDVHSAVIPVAHWRYDIAATESGCVVTESTWDNRPGWFRKVAGYATGVHDRVTANTSHIEATLQRLKARAESDPAR